MQPLSEDKLHYLPQMAKYDSKKVLWENVQKRMISLWEKENLTRLCKDAKIGPGTASRIKDQSTSVGIDVLEKLSEALGVPPWELLNPDMGNPKQTKPVPNEISGLQKIYNHIPDDKKKSAMHDAMVEMLKYDVESTQPTQQQDQSGAVEKPSASRPTAPAVSKTR